MKDSVETKTSYFKGKKTQKTMLDFDAPVHAARSREMDRGRQQPPSAPATTPPTNPIQNFNLRYCQMEESTNALFAMLVNS